MHKLTVCVSALQSWATVCDQLHVSHGEADRLMAQAQDGVVPLGQFVSALETIATTASLRDLGWSVGERYDLRLLGEVGSAMLSASTLGSGLRRIIDYFSLMQDAAEFELRQDADQVVLSYRILDPEIWPRQQDALFTLSIIAQLLRRAIGFGWDQVQVALESDDPAIAAELCRRTGVACSDNADSNSIRFPAHFMALPLVASGDVIPPDYRALNRNMVRKRRAMSIELRVRTAVYRHLGSDTLDQEHIAGELGMSTRTLRRKLAEENSSFQQILYACRMRQAALQFSLRRTVSIADMALRLGYSEHSAFTRAFSRWSGMPPHIFQQAGRSVASAF
ncbi:AraC family transcriptional regulator [Sphingobium sufflavum]|uniref:AraC-like transcriptional regulator QhpR n=1 Tax=Sphingobium sufflavum TaxID=1129547 RepID=UPI001F3E5E46|nr:AraC family transcriptional regulator [Sphingobium sufflavum]MCE7796690.1 AraC family transcriptional regulator [Sphingobium sufflavum]